MEKDCFFVECLKIFQPFLFRDDFRSYNNSILNVASTLGTEMSGVDDFWLETRVIIRISTHPC